MIGINQPVTGDALGAAMAARRTSPETLQETFLELHDGTLVDGHLASYFTPPSQWSALEHWTVECARGRVLDIGAGSGKFAAVMTTKPEVEQVLCIDVSPGAVQEARQRGLSAETGAFPVTVPRKHAAGYDAVCLLGNNLGLLAQAPSLGEGLGVLRGLISDGGQVIGTAGSVELLPGRLKQANRAAGVPDGWFSARFRFQNMATPWFAYTFLDLEDFIHECKKARLDASESMATGPQWGVLLTAMD